MKNRLEIDSRIYKKSQNVSKSPKFSQSFTNSNLNFQYCTLKWTKPKVDLKNQPIISKSNKIVSKSA